MPVTMLYAGLLGLWFVALSVKVIQGRGRYKVNLGDGGNASMQRLIRGQANFNEYVPLALLLMALLESAGTSALVMHALGASLLVARILHGVALSFTEHFFFGRFVGTLLTYLMLVAAAGLCLWQFFA